AAEYTSRRATSPGLIWHPVRPRTPTCELARGRLSDQRFGAYPFRLYRDAAALNLLVRLRRFIAEPLPALTPQVQTGTTSTPSGAAAAPAEETGLPCGGVDGGGAAAPLPAAAAARPAGGRSSVHRARAAPPGGRGSRCQHAADRGEALIGRTAPRWVSSGLGAGAWSGPETRSLPWGEPG